MQISNETGASLREKTNSVVGHVLDPPWTLKISTSLICSEQGRVGRISFEIWPSPGVKLKSAHLHLVRSRVEMRRNPFALGSWPDFN